MKRYALGIEGSSGLPATFEDEQGNLVSYLEAEALRAENEGLRAIAAELLDEAERRGMGFPSKWSKAEEWFAFRDHAKAALASKPQPPSAGKENKL